MCVSSEKRVAYRPFHLLVRDWTVAVAFLRRLEFVKGYLCDYGIMKKEMLLFWQTANGRRKVALNCELHTRARTVLDRWVSVLLTLGMLDLKCRRVYTEQQKCSPIVTSER